MDASEWTFLVAMIAVWLVGSALVGLFGIRLSHIEEPRRANTCSIRPTWVDWVGYGF